MANFNPIETSNLPDFSFDDYIDLPNYGAVFEEQTVAQSNFELDNSNTFGQYTPGVIDEQYRLPEIPPSNPFLGSPMEVVQFSGFANDILAPSQQSQSFYLNNVLQPSLSQQQYQTPYQVEHGLSGQYGVDGLATGYTSFSFNHMPSSDDTRISNAAEFSPYQQAFQPSGNSSSPSIPQEIHAQQSSSLGRLGSASLSCSVRPSEQGLVLTGASQPMVSFLFFY
jgi:hypothetical protein